MNRRIISLLLVLSLLIGAAVRPQRAGAVVATTAAVAASAAAILTACGVTYWAASQTDAIDYIAGKIDEYLSSIDEPDITYEQWLDIGSTSQLFEVAAGGVMRFGAGVANKLLDFCRWLQNDEGIESGGQDVQDVSNIYQGFANQPLAKTSTSSTTVDRFAGSYVAASQSYNPDDGYKYVIAIDDISSGLIYCATYGNSGLMLLSRNYFIGTLYSGTSSNFRGSGFYSFLSNGYQKANLSFNSQLAPITYNHYNTEQEALAALIYAVDYEEQSVRITPSDFVNIPAAIDSDTVFAVKPSVDLASGDSVDDATDAILDGITSEDGLSSVVDDTPDTSFGWLYNLLVNIAEAITDGVADIKQAVLGLAASIYNQFTQVLQDIKTGIQGIALDIYTEVINALTYVFVPSQAFIDTYIASLYATFDNHFSILSYPFSILGEFITRASGIGSPEPMFTWGNIYEPFSGKLLIAAGSYNLNSMLSNQTFAQVYSIYMIVVKGLISFAFLKFLYSWFCDVFKMREDDFSSPLDVDYGDDAEDFDGYDGYYTS